MSVTPLRGFVARVIFGITIAFGAGFAHVLVSTAQEEAVTCPGFMVSRLTIGGNGQVTPGSSNNLRDTPSTSGALLGQIPGAGRFSVLDGPVCSDNTAWWLVSDGVLTGWTAEGMANDYWLLPDTISLDPVTGDRVCASEVAASGQGYSLRELPVYTQPDTSEPETDIIPEHTVFTVLSELPAPCDADRRWLEVEYDGLIGWSLEYFFVPEGKMTMIRTAPNPLILVETEPGTDPLQSMTEPVTGAIGRQTIDQLELVQTIGTGNVVSTAWSADGTRVAVASSTEVSVYDVRTLNRPLAVFQPPEGSLLSIAFSPNGSVVATVDSSGMIFLWDSVSFEPVSSLMTGSGNCRIAFSPSGNSIAVACWPQSGVVVWDISEPANPVESSRFAAGDSRVAFITENRLLSASDRGLYLFDLRAQETVDLDGDLLEDGHSRRLNSWVIDTESNMLHAILGTVLGTDFRLVLTYSIVSWDLETGAEVAIENLNFSTVDRLLALPPQNEPFPRLAVLTEGRVSVSAESATAGSLWNVTGVTAYTADESSGLMAIGNRDGVVYLYRGLTQVGALFGFADSVNWLMFSPGGQYLMGAGEDASVRVWEVNSQQRLGSILLQPVEPRFLLSPDQTSFFSGGQRWNIATGQAQDEAPFPYNQVLGQRTDGAVVTVGDAGTVIVTEATGMEVLLETNVRYRYGNAVLSADGTLMAYGISDDELNYSGDYSGVEILNLMDGRTMLTLDNYFLGAQVLGISPDNRLLIISESRPSEGDWATSLVVAEIETGALLANIPLTASGVIPTFRYSPDGRSIAWFSFQGSTEDATLLKQLHVMNLQSRMERILIEDARHLVSEILHFSPDGTLLITADPSGNLYVYDSQTGALVRTLEAHRSSIVRVEFSDDGQRMFTSGFDALFRIWGIP